MPFVSTGTLPACTADTMTACSTQSARSGENRIRTVPGMGSTAPWPWRLPRRGGSTARPPCTSLYGRMHQGASPWHLAPRCHYHASPEGFGHQGIQSKSTVFNLGPVVQGHIPSLGWCGSWRGCWYCCFTREDATRRQRLPIGVAHAHGLLHSDLHTQGTPGGFPLLGLTPRVYRCRCAPA